MKKIIKSSILALGVCFTAGQATAQLASDAPAMTAGKVAEIQQKQAQAAAVKAEPAAAKSTATPISNQGGVTPVLTAPELKTAPVSPAVQAKTVKVEPVQTVPSPAIQMIPVGTLKSSVASQAPATTASSTKVVEVALVPSSSVSGKTVAIPQITLMTDNSEAKSVPAVNATQLQVQGQAKPAQIVETPNSTPSPALKLPVVPAQTKGKE